MKKTLNAQEKQWRTESDASAITRYNEVIADPERFKLAKEYLQEQQETINNAVGSLQNNEIMNKLIRGEK